MSLRKNYFIELSNKPCVYRSMFLLLINVLVFRYRSKVLMNSNLCIASTAIISEFLSQFCSLSKILHRGERKLCFGSPDPLWFTFPVYRDVNSGKKKFLQFFFAGFCFWEAIASLSPAYSGSFSRFRPIKASCASLFN